MSRRHLGFIVLAFVPIFIGLSIWFGHAYKEERRSEKANNNASSWTKEVQAMRFSPVERPKAPLVINRAYTPFSKRVDGKLLWGYLHTKNLVTKVLVEPKYDKAQPFYGRMNHRAQKDLGSDRASFWEKRINQNLFAIVSHKDKNILLNGKGKPTMEALFDIIKRSADERLLIVRKNRKYGVIRVDMGSLPFPQLLKSRIRYDRIKPFSVLLLKRPYPYARPPSTLFYYVRKDGKFNYLNQDGEPILSHTQNFTKLFPIDPVSGRVIVQDQKTFFITSIKDRRRVKLPFDEIYSNFSNTAFFAKKKLPSKKAQDKLKNNKGLFGLYSSRGKILSKPKFKAFSCLENPNIFHPNSNKINPALFTVRIGSKWGILSRFGDLVVKPIYDKIECFKPRSYDTTVYTSGKASQICFDGLPLPSQNDIRPRPLKILKGNAHYKCFRRWRKKYKALERQWRKPIATTVRG